MKKVVHLTSAHPPDDVRIFYKECLSLKAMGFEVVLVAQAEADRICEGIQIRAVRKTRSRFVRMTLLLWEVYRVALREDAEIYHFHDPELIPIGFFLQRKGKKVIYDVHEDVPRDILIKSWLPKKFRKMTSVLFEQFELYIAKKFSALVTVTPQISERFSRLNVVEVRNYPDMHEFKSVQPALNTSFICYAGLITPQRGIFEMASLVRKEDFSLLLAGKFSSEVLKSQIFYAYQRVYYLGNLGRQDLFKVYEKSLVGLALLHAGPTFGNALPIKLFEYMAAGLPVIASHFPAWREIIEYHGCGFCVDPHNSEEITERICFLRDNKETAKEMGERGRAAIREEYDWNTQASKLSSLYQQLLES